MPPTTNLEAFTICASNGSTEKVITGYGNSRDECLSDAINQLCGYRLLWGHAPNNAGTPSPAAPDVAGSHHGTSTFESMHEEAGSPGANVGNGPILVPGPFQLGQRVIFTRKWKQGEPGVAANGAGKVTLIMFSDDEPLVSYTVSFDDGGEIEVATPDELELDSTAAPTGSETALGASVPQPLRLPSRFQVGDSVQCCGGEFTVDRVIFAKGKVLYDLANVQTGDDDMFEVDSNDVEPIGGDTVESLPGATADDGGAGVSQNATGAASEFAAGTAGTVPTTRDPGFTTIADHDGGTGSGITGERAEVVSNDFTRAGADSGQIQPLPGEPAQPEAADHADGVSPSKVGEVPAEAVAGE